MKPFKLSDHPEWAAHEEKIATMRKLLADIEAGARAIPPPHARPTAIDTVAARIVAGDLPHVALDDLPDHDDDTRKARVKTQSRIGALKQALKLLDQQGTALHTKCSAELCEKHGVRQEQIKRLRRFRDAGSEFVAAYESLCALASDLHSANVAIPFPCVGNGCLKLGPVADANSIWSRWLCDVRDKYPDLADEFQPEKPPRLLEKMFG